MDVVVLGASGGCGRWLVKMAKDRGLRVVAVGRESSQMDVPEDVAVRRGSLDDEDFLTEVMDGADVALVALGLRLSGLSPFASVEDQTFLRRSGPAIARAAERAGVRRILAISAGGAGDSYDDMPAFFKAFIALTAMRKVYPELDRFEEALFDGAVEACCVRPTGLTDEPATGEARVVTRLGGQAQIPRADVAAFMLDHLEGPLPGHGPVITVTGGA